MPATAKCATHAYSEFNLATSKELFSYCEAIISLCNLLQNLANANFMIAENLDIATFVSKSYKNSRTNKKALLSTDKGAFFNDVCLWQIMLLALTMTALPNDVCLTAN